MKFLTLLLVGLLACASPAQTAPSVRWDQPTVTVYIQPARNLGMEWGPADSTNVVQAFKQWEQEIPTRFTFVSDSLRADIKVNWIYKFNEPISGLTVVGWEQTERYIIHGRVTLAARRSNGDFLDNSARMAITLHEIGHVIGMKHNDAGNSIMRPMISTRTLSDEDRQNARQLYSVPPGTELPVLSTFPSLHNE